MLRARRPRKLTQLDTAVHAEEDVVALDVSVNDRARMEELERFQALRMGNGQD